MFSKILIANRGEIAVRIIRACKEMGVSTVAVYSSADKDALFVSMADESFCIGGARAKDSYLNMPAIMTACALSGAQAIHPGYGLLSENAKFAQLCNKCGVTFIGPCAEVISKMGDKDEARRTMKAAGVPVIPGSDLLENEEQAADFAEKIGYPVLIKAKAGGGGRGIRRVDCKEDIAKAFNDCASEAQSAFGDGGVYMEKFLSPVKHIEVQILADNYGNVVALGERDCSMQRRNQKLVEESPALCVNSDLREKLCECSIQAAKAVGYTGVGTIEYLLDRNGDFYFMEMNTRLQVEHPVTEMVTGIDLVKWQIRVSCGKEINFTHEQTRIKGCAIECRINSDNSAREQSGEIKLLHVPGGPWVRFDTAIYQGYKIPPFYDSMIGKLIVFAGTRQEAIRKMKAALSELIIDGISTNAQAQLELISGEEFTCGEYFTNTVGG